MKIVQQGINDLYLAYNKNESGGYEPLGDPFPYFIFGPSGGGSSASYSVRYQAGNPNTSGSAVRGKPSTLIKMEDGAIVGLKNPQRGTFNNTGTAYIRDRVSDIVPCLDQSASAYSGDLSYGGKSYKLAYMTCGYKATDGSDVVGRQYEDDDLMYRYIRSCENSNISVWPGTSLQSVKIAAPEPYAPASGKPVQSLFIWETATGNWSDATYRTPTNGGEGVFTNGDGSNQLFVPIVLLPQDYLPILTIDESLGTKGAAFDIPVHVEYKGKTKLPELTLKKDGAVWKTFTDVNVGDVELEVTAEEFSALPYGLNAFTATAKNDSGESAAFEKAFSFTKTDAYIELQGNVVEYESMPLKCTIVSSVVLGESATAEWWVANNALDDVPTWEQYTGAGHEFGNSSKAAEKWGVSWKCKIGGEEEGSYSELLKHVGMAVS